MWVSKPRLRHGIDHGTLSTAMPQVPLLTALTVLPAVLSAQDPSVGWVGDPPRQGAFAYVEVRAASEPVAVRGTLRGVPLFFERLGPDRFVALAGVALDAADSLLLGVRLVYDGGRMVRHERYLPVTAGQFASERLSVAPEFTRRPDSALAARIARENAAAAEVSRLALRTRRLWREAFAPPREGRITSAYGTGRVFNGAVQSRHWGVDFDGAMGAPVHAAGRGVVALVGDFYYAGRVVYLNHGAGVVTAYLHLSAVDVAEGDTVATGQRLGAVGQSGRVTGPHLHWAARYGATSLDGTTLLALPAFDALRDGTR
jgi:murein DD-endopeptidase MepM/ murein hydrolase activator NlpD